jgi:hypothetical protein
LRTNLRAETSLRNANKMSSARDDDSRDMSRRFQTYSKMYSSRRNKIQENRNRRSTSGSLSSAAIYKAGSESVKNRLFPSIRRFVRRFLSATVSERNSEKALMENLERKTFLQTLF